MHTHSRLPLALAALVLVGSYQNTRPVIAETLVAAGVLLVLAGAAALNPDQDQGYTPTPQRRSAPTPSCFHVDTATEQDRFTNTIDALFMSNAQPYAGKNNIQILKTRIRTAITARINMSCYVNESAASRDLHTYVREQTVVYIKELARDHALRAARNIRSNPPVNPIYLNDIDANKFAQDACIDIEREVRNLFEAGHSGSLATYVGDALHQRIGQIAANHYIRSTPKHSPPSYEQATRTSNEIYEIYPHEGSAKRNQTVENLSNSKHHRTSECCICYRQYSKIGYRVNLPCGHDLCPDCLYQIKYGSGADQNQACPQCRASVSTSDYPPNYLRKYAHI